MLRTLLLSLASLAFMVLTGCNNEKTVAAARNPVPASTESAATPAAGDMPSESGVLAGQVLETMDAGTYTYVKVRTATGEVWAAGPTATVAVGDQVKLPKGMLMTNFESPSLKRTFPEIYFVNAIEKSGTGGVPSGHTAMPTGEPGAEHSAPVMGGKAVAVGSITRAAGGRTVAEIHADRAGLGGQRVKVRGQVVKSTPNVMGRNWLHIQDGSAEGAPGDLTVTTESGSAKVGDVVLVEGKVAVDRDLGSGYRYEVLVEDATVTVEPH
jgi:hypothetical protein